MKTTKYIAGVAAFGLFTAVNINQSILAQDTVHVLDEVLIHDSRVSNKAPLTTSTMSKESLSDNKVETSIPYIIELQPSVVASTENCAAGNTSLRIRGVDASRINVNINGITLNDAESQSVYWVNIPNLGGMAQSLQIQRGVGASNGGSPAFGGAINLQTINAQSEPYGIADLSVGSWNTRQYGIAAGTGITKKGFSFDMAYSGLGTDGFIRNGYSDQQSLFLSASHYGERSLLKAVFFMGSQTTGITWNGAYADDLDKDKHYNDAGAYYDDMGNLHYYDNETDNYWQQHYQLYFNYLLTDSWSMNAALDFTHGDGYYENYRYDKKASKYGLTIGGNGSAKGDFITRKEMDNNAVTFNFGARHAGEKLSLSFGENLMYYHGEHFGNVIWGKDPTFNFTEDSPFEWYRNTGDKAEATTFVKLNYDINENFNLYGDLQYRYVHYEIDGVEDDGSLLDFTENYSFFNPKAGLNWRLTDHQRTYFVAGISQREPTRANIKDKLLVGDTIKAEAMLDIEFGYQLSTNQYGFSANLYAMLYKDQLTASGKLNDVGYALMENVDKSYRIGIELEGGYRFCNWFKMDANLTLSTNKIIDYTYTDFEDGGTVMVTRTENTDLSFSPALVGAIIATIEPIKDWKIQLAGKYVGEMYGDNTSRNVYKQDAFFLLNAKTSYTWHLGGSKELEAQFVVHNLLDHDYRIIAWVGDWVDDYSVAGSNIYYNSTGFLQQPGINCTARMVLRF
ncbi:MAG: TonB-dependent receptor [Bacteroidales bacterium]|nr:TonB-dependent receptor [Bacteroidales bacterium]